MRITKKIFNDLAIWMIGFGILIGIVFPFFTRLFGVKPEIAYSPGFFPCLYRSRDHSRGCKYNSFKGSNSKKIEVNDLQDAHGPGQSYENHKRRKPG